MPLMRTTISFTREGMEMIRDAARRQGSREQREQVDVIVPADPQLITSASAAVPLGGAVHDTAFLSGGVKPTGTINFRLYNPGDRTCTGSPAFTSTVAIDGNGAYTSEALFEVVTAAELVPRSPLPGEPTFDIAWENGEAIVGAEVKSLTRSNEERQMRLALRQVLRYAQLSEAKGRPVRRVIATEREPTDASWSELCRALGVALVWPTVFESLFERP